MHHSFLYISFPSVHDLTSRFVEDVNTRQRLPFFLQLRYSLLQFNSRKSCQHLTNWERWNKGYKGCSSATSLFRWRFRSRRRRRRCCSSSLFTRAHTRKLYLIAKFVVSELMLITMQRTRPAWPAKTKLRMTLDCSRIAKEIVMMSGIFVEGRRQILLYSFKRQE